MELIVIMDLTNHKTKTRPPSLPFPDGNGTGQGVAKRHRPTEYRDSAIVISMSDGALPREQSAPLTVQVIDILR